MTAVYYAYSDDLERHLGDFYLESDGACWGKRFAEWENSLSEPNVHFTFYKGSWFKSRINSSNMMDKVSIDELPKDLQMKTLMGAL